MPYRHQGKSFWKRFEFIINQHLTGIFREYELTDWNKPQEYELQKLIPEAASTIFPVSTHKNLVPIFRDFD